jgi:hypothetical protein
MLRLVMSTGHQMLFCLAEKVTKMRVLDAWTTVKAHNTMAQIYQLRVMHTSLVAGFASSMASDELAAFDDRMLQSLTVRPGVGARQWRQHLARQV